MSVAIKNGWRMKWMAALAAFCFFSAWAVEAAPADRVVVGLALDLSGPGAAAGREARNALLLEMGRINRRGVAGGRIFLLTLDTKGRPGAAATAVRSLVRKHKAVAVIGPVEYYAAIAAAKAAQEERVPLFSLAAPEEILVPARRWVFSTAIPAGLSVRAILGHLKSRGIKRAAMLGSSLGYGTEGREQITALAPDFGVSILLNESFKPGEHNFLPFLKRASLRGVGGFIHWARGGARVDLVRARAALDLEIPLYLSYASPGMFGSESGSRAAEGVVFPASWITAAHLLPETHPARKDIKAFRDEYLKAYQSAPGETAAAAVDALRILAWSARGVGANRARIPAGVEGARYFMGLNGTYGFSGIDHNGLGTDSLALVHIVKGKWELVEKGR